MAQKADIAKKILPFGAIKAPAKEVIPVNCTREEIKMLVLARLRSTLKKYGASYSTVDQFLTVLDLLLDPDYCRDRSSSIHRHLVYELLMEGEIAIVHFSPIDVYKIVDKPSPNPQIRS